jgi:molybdopterin-guanine dinucleotide biosynthesis protein A
MKKSMNALILAGGENKRLPILKGFLEIDGKRIIESNIDVLERIFDKVIISTNDPEHYFYLGRAMVGDTMRQRGPMTGIVSVLNIPKISEIFVTACDMPFISAELIRSIVEQWDKKWDAVVPVFNKKPQPLLGIYAKTIAQNMEKSIKRGKRSLMQFLKGINVLYIDEKEVRKIDRTGKSFVNINTPEDAQNVTGKGVNS